jgi:hypothetical protein
MKAFVIIAGLFLSAFAFRTVSVPNEPPLLPGAIRPQDAAAHIGENIEVEGIAWVHEKAQATFLDLGGDYPNEALAVVIWPGDRGQFGNVAALDGKPVAVRGEVRRYRGAVEIVVRGKDQIRAL